MESVRNVSGTGPYSRCDLAALICRPYWWASYHASATRPRHRATSPAALIATTHVPAHPLSGVEELNNTATPAQGDEADAGVFA